MDEEFKILFNDAPDSDQDFKEQFLELTLMSNYGYITKDDKYRKTLHYNFIPGLFHLLIAIYRHGYFSGNYTFYFHISTFLTFA